MLEELLFALHGYVGNIFIRGSAPVSGRGDIIHVNPSIDLLHPSEVALLNRLCRLGTTYSAIEAFIKQHDIVRQLETLVFKGLTASKRSSSMFQPTGSMTRAALAEGLNACMDGYRTRLLLIEKEVLKNDNVNPMFILAHLSDFELLFPVLEDVITEVQRLDATGGQILTILFDATHSGISFVQEHTTKLLQLTHKVMYKQLLLWMSKGLLDDIVGEFFIEKISDTGEFSVRSAMLPGYVTADVAQKILFAGKFVAQFLVKDQNASSLDFDLSQLNQTVATTLEPVFNTTQEFDVLKFDSAVEHIRATISQDLWTLLVEKASLIKQLSVLKDVFLLGRGELFLAFIEMAEPCLSKVVGRGTEQEANAAFRRAVSCLYFEDPSLDAVSIRIIPHEAAQTKNASAWNCVEFVYQPGWPLNLVITSGILVDLNRIFQFLFRVRRAQMRLHLAWFEVGSVKNKQKLHQHRQKWQLRMLLLFLLDNLQYYLHVDVLESLYAKLCSDVRATQDFEKLSEALREFLDKLRMHCFMLLQTAEQCVTGLLDTCEEFTQWCAAGALQNDGSGSQLQELYVKFQRQSSMFYKILSNVKAQRASPFLMQLLARIDYNRYFSSTSLF